MLDRDLRALQDTLARTLRISAARVRRALLAEDNVWRLRRMSGRDAGSAVAVPREDGTVVIASPKRCEPGWGLVEVFRFGPEDMAAWKALPASERTPPAGTESL